MAFFNKTKKTNKKDSKKAVNQKSGQMAVTKRGAPNRSVLQSVRVTEKAVIGTPETVYVFTVNPHSTKPEIAAAVRAEYSVTPLAVRTTKVAKKPIYRSSGWSHKGGGKKAYVTLKEGDTIAIA